MKDTFKLKDKNNIKFKYITRTVHNNFFDLQERMVKKWHKKTVNILHMSPKN